MMLATRSNRSVPLDAFTGDLDAFVGRVFGREYASTLAPYGVDIREDVDHLYVDAELPGFTRDQIDVTLDNRVLTITAARGSGEEPKPQAPTDAPQSAWLLRERRYSRFERSFQLPETVDGSQVDAKLNDGVLHLTLNKRQETKPRKIAIG